MRVTLAFQRPIVAKFFNKSFRLSCNCFFAALLSAKSRDYAVVSCGSNIPFQSRVHFFAIFDPPMFKLRDIEFPCSFRKKC